MKQKNKINYDKKKDILYIFLREGTEERFEDISENITVEYDAEDRPLGIEIFNASKILPARPQAGYAVPRQTWEMQEKLKENKNIVAKELR